MVSVIIPVFNGLEHVKGLLPDIFDKTPENDVRFIVVDDASTDENVSAHLRALEGSDPRFTLVRNPTNLGFVKSVNIAMRMADGDDCVLLNSDTQVPRGWLSRLMAPIRQNPTVASSTPFSNGATIFSVPVANSDNREMMRRFSVDYVDGIVASLDLPKDCLEAPVGHGFCMAMSAQAIKVVGVLDEEAFGKGYGEEVDWCMRATAAGYRHVVAPGLFVAHHHCGSFPSEEKRRLIAEHCRTIHERYPFYREMNRAHFVSGNRKKWDEFVANPLLERLAADWNGKGRPAKRALLVCHEMTRTGAPQSLLRQARYLIEAGYIVDVVYLRSGPLLGEFIGAGCRTESVDPGERTETEACAALARRRYDIVVCNTVVSFRFVRGLRHSKRVIWFLREIATLQKVMARSAVVSSLVRDYPYQCMCTVSRYAADTLKAYNPSIRYINNSVADEFSGFAAVGDTVRFGYIGAINPNKNIRGLVAAFMALQQRFPRATLDICGKEIGEPVLTKELQALTAGNPNIRWLGPVEGDAKMRFFGFVDVLCVPSLSEASCLSLMEGAMHGKAIVSTDCVGANYVLDDGGGVVVKAGDETALRQAMEELAAAPDRVREMQRAARTGYLKHCTPEKERVAFLSLVAEVEERGTMAPPLVSVVIPVFNAEQYLRECLDSVLAQPFARFEVICVDDGSTDGSASILEEYAARDMRVRCVHRENGGAGAARNTGISYARGRYLHFCDSDDVMRGDLLRKMYDAAESASADVTVCRLARYDCATGKERASSFSGKLQELLKEGRRWVTPDEVSDELFTMAGYGPTTKLLLRSFVEERRLRFQEIGRTNDMFFVAAALANAARIAAVDEPLYRYRVGIRSVTHDDRLAASFCDALTALKDRLVADGLYEKFSDCFLRTAVNSFINNVITCYSAAALEKLYPKMRKTLLGLLPPQRESVEAIVCSQLQLQVCRMAAENESPLPVVMAILQDFRDRTEDCRHEIESLRTALGNAHKIAAQPKPATRPPAAKPAPATTARPAAQRSQPAAKPSPRLVAAEAEVLRLRQRIARAEKGISDLQHSESYRTGMFITWPLRKIYRLFRPLKTAKTAKG